MMQERYDPAAVEQAARDYWNNHGSFDAKELVEAGIGIRQVVKIAQRKRGVG